VSVRGRVSALSGVAVGRFWRQTVLLLVALALLNGSNYVFHVVVSRLLGPSSYGSLASLLAVVMVLSVPFGVLQTVVAQKGTALVANGRALEVSDLAAGALKGLTPIAWLVAAAVALAAPLLSSFLHLGIASTLLLAPYVLLSILGSVPMGALQGQLRFGAIAALVLGGVAVRLGLGTGLVAAGAGVPGAVLATAVAPVVTLAGGLPLLRIGRNAWRATRRSLAPLLGDFAPALLGLTAFWLLAEIDIALARHYLGHDAAGFYSSAGLLARALLFLPAAVSIVAFPRFVAARESGVGEARWLRVSLLCVGVLAATVLPAVVLLRGFLVDAAFGERYRPAQQLLPILAPAMALLALVSLLVYFHIAMRTRAYVLLFGAAATESVLIAFFHGSGRGLAWIVFAVAAATAVLQYATAASVCRWKPLAESADMEETVGLAAPPSVELSVVLPCYNAGSNLASVLACVERELTEVDSYELIVVSDGSTDDTVTVAHDFGSQAVRVIEYETRSGKGNALRLGLKQARGVYVAFLDADGDIAADAIRPFLGLMKLYEPDIVLGSKRHPLSEVHYPRLRRLLSWAYHKLGRLLFRVNVRDTQTGLKLIRRDVLQAVLPRMLEKRYAFDLELLVVARCLGFSRVMEAPIRLDYKFSSKVEPRAVFRILVDTLAIFYRRYILDTYRVGRVDARLPSERRAREGKLRVLFVNWRDICNPDAGGAEIWTHEVAKRWVAQGHEVSLLTSSFRGARRVETVDGVRITRKGRLRRGTFHLLVQKEFARLRGYDLVIDEINTIPFFTPLWRHRLPPVIALIHQLAADVWDAELPRALAAIGRRLEPCMLRLYRETPLVAVSESTRADLEALGLRKVQVVHGGRDEPPDLEDVSKEDVPTLLFVGRLTRNKRPDHAIAAFKRIRESLPDARLWVIGRGPLEPVLRTSLPEGVELLGHLPRRELHERMARAHCLLVPSVREGWGLVVIEANSAGTPAIGYDVPGVRDSIRDHLNGIVVPSGNPEGLAIEASRLLSEPTQYQQTSRQARDWARGFSWDVTADRFLEAVMSQAHLNAAGEVDVGEATPHT
jgi:glycosyltransferase involved in cell wall biosynthesis/O-antigen/teichoic acid export membrane protein